MDLAGAARNDKQDGRQADRVIRALSAKINLGVKFQVFDRGEQRGDRPVHGLVGESGVRSPGYCSSSARSSRILVS